jgi:HPt (histidine-containing phosphotransfer) domain-containing protein
MQDAQQQLQLQAETEVSTMLTRVHALGGADSPFVNECLQLWLEQMASDLAAVQVAVARADAETVARCAHTMKGSCLTVGASQLQALAAQLETEAQSGTLASLETERRGLVELYERVSVLLWPVANRR